MSKRIYRTHSTEESSLDEPLVEPGTPVQVEAGWDRPLSRLFLCIYRLDEIDGQDVETLYSNLDAEDDPAETQGSIKRTLREYGLQWPDAWWRALQQDHNVALRNAKDPPVGSRAGNDTRRFGHFVPKSFEDRLRSKLDEIRGLGSAIRTYNGGAATPVNPPIFGAMVQLGLLNPDEERLQKAHEIIDEHQRADG